MQASIVAGTMKPVDANVDILTYMSTYVLLVGFSALTDFVACVTQWTISQGGSKMVWSGFMK
jgi:hypothetical protein